MATSTATVTTLNASRYLQQLCKHWSHRFAVTFDHAKGEVDFGEGQSVELSASHDALTMSVHDSNESGLAELENVLAHHLKRFAFRETMEFDWKRLA